MNILHSGRFALVVMIAGVLALAGAQASTVAAPVAEDDPGSLAELSNLGLAYHLFDAVFNGKDTAAASLLVSEDAVIGTTYGEFTGPEGLLDYVETMKRTYPGARFEITSISLSDDSVVVGWTMTAKTIVFGPYVQPTSTFVEMQGVATIYVADAKVANLSLDTSPAVVTDPTDAVAVTDSGPCPSACNF